MAPTMAVPVARRQGGGRRPHFSRSISNGMPPNWVSAVMESPLIVPSLIRAGSLVGEKSMVTPVTS